MSTGIIDGDTGAEEIIEAECDPDAPRLLSASASDNRRETVYVRRRGALVPVGEWVVR